MGSVWRVVAMNANLRFLDPPHGPVRTLAASLLALLVACPLAAQFGAIGLSAVGAQRFDNEDLLFFEPQGSDHFARVLATGDFNGDGADDLATGMPHDNGIVGFEIGDCGAVVVRYGVPAGGLATGLASTLLNQVGGGGPDPAEAGDNFGGALAACDFNGDGFDDLAVGIPNEDVGSGQDAGAVQIYYGAAAGLGSSAQLLTQATAGIPGDPEFQDFFGFSLACGRFNGDAFADLAIGAPGEDFEGAGLIRAGTIITLHGAAAGLDPSTSVSINQDTPPITGTAESNDLFGWALTTGNFNSDGHDDLAIGIPGEDGPSFGDGRGAVAILFGNANPFPFGGNLLFTETDLGGIPEDDDQLGYSLAAGDFNGDLFTDLAMGAPFEDINATLDAGQVGILYFGPNPPPPARWAEHNIHGAAASEAGDLFGFSLAAGDFDRDGRDDLAMGHPNEGVIALEDGTVTVIMGSSAGLSNARRYGITPGFHGYPLQVNEGNRNFGFAVASGDFNSDGHADLAIGAPNEDENGITNVGAEIVVYGSLFSDGFEAGNTGFWSLTVP